MHHCEVSHACVVNLPDKPSILRQSAMTFPRPNQVMIGVYAERMAMFLCRLVTTGSHYDAWY